MTAEIPNLAVPDVSLKDIHRWKEEK